MKRTDSGVFTSSGTRRSIERQDKKRIMKELGITGKRLRALQKKSRRDGSSLQKLIDSKVSA